MENTTQPMVITPTGKAFWMKLTMLAPLSHHDPAQADKSNFSLFRRQKQKISLQPKHGQITQGEIDNLCQMFPIPADITPFFQQASFAQFVGAALGKLFLDMYNHEDGEGLFSGVERYRMMETRFSQSAIRVHTLYEFWATACHELQTGINDSRYDKPVLTLLSIPSIIGTQVLHEFSQNMRLLTLLAREWHTTAKNQSPEYAKKKKQEQANPENVTLSFKSENQAFMSQLWLQVPTFSGNSVRHEMVREPGLWHLFHRVGIGFQSVPKGVQALFENGNNIAGGSSAPSNAYALSQQIKEMFPLLGLLSGSTDSWLLGEGNLQAVNAWIVCKENNDALALAGIESRESIFEMLDSWTLNRLQGRAGTSPMPYSFEVLSKGTEILVRFALSPYATELEIGALLAALTTYRRADSTLGGQAARNFGLAKCEWLHGELSPDDAHAEIIYEKYLEENKDMLRRELQSGELGAGVIVCK